MTNKYDTDMLKEIEKRDKCKIIYDESIKKYNRNIKIKFKCYCGKDGEKVFRKLELTGALCKECAKLQKSQKIKESVKTSYNINMLTEIEARDKCKIEYDESIKIYNRDMKIKFACNCGKKDEKAFRYLEKNGAYCKECQVNKKIKRSKATNIERYGVDNPQKNKEIKEKTEKTNLEKYGAKCSLGNKEVKGKALETMKEKYGAKYALQVEEFKGKIKDTCIEKYGVEHVLQNNEIYNKMKASTLERYGVEYNSQNAEISEKQSRNSYNLKEFKFPTGEIIKVRGYEPYLLKYLVQELNYSYNEIITNRTKVPVIWYKKPNNIKKSRYYCDIYIPKTNTIYEVKSTWTYKKDIEDIPLKKQACIDGGYNFELFVYNEKGEKQL